MSKLCDRHHAPRISAQREVIEIGFAILNHHVLKERLFRMKRVPDRRLRLFCKPCDNDIKSPLFRAKNLPVVKPCDYIILTKDSAFRQGKTVGMRCNSCLSRTRTSHKNGIDVMHYAKGI